MKTMVNGNVIEGRGLAAYTARAARADRERQRRNMLRKCPRAYPAYVGNMSTEDYVRGYFRLNNGFAPCTYIIGGKAVVL